MTPAWRALIAKRRRGWRTCILDRLRYASKSLAPGSRAISRGPCAESAPAFFAFVISTDHAACAATSEVDVRGSEIRERAKSSSVFGEYRTSRPALTYFGPSLLVHRSFARVAGRRRIPQVSSKYWLAAGGGRMKLPRSIIGLPSACPAVRLGCLRVPDCDGRFLEELGICGHICENYRRSKVR
jgi:hypothetical protein